MMLHHLYKCSNNHDLQLDDLLKTETTEMQLYSDYH